MLRVVILGAGKMALQHASAIRLRNNAQLVAVADPYVAPDDIKERFGQSVQAFTDPLELLQSCEPDVAHIVTPPSTHVRLTRLCLDRGVHAYVEKPFAPTAKEAQELLELASAKNLKLCPAHQLLFQQPGRRYRNFLPIIGDIVNVESYFSFRPLRRRPDGGAPLSAVDQLIDILPHPVYLLLSALTAEGSAEPELGAIEVDTEGEVRAIIRSNGALATLTVTLRGRPVESYLKVVGTNGSVVADFVIGSIVKLLGPGASAPALVTKPFSQSMQMAFGSLTGLFRLILSRHKSYPGLAELLEGFYSSIETNSVAPIDRGDILHTVRICEKIGFELRLKEESEEDLYRRQLAERTRALPRVDPARGITLVTGGTGFLGRAVLKQLRSAGFAVRALCRKIPPAKRQIPGIEYVQADLSVDIPQSAMKDVAAVVHLAAETAGNLAAHERNTVEATRNLLDSMESAGVRRLINISSVAVLQPGTASNRLDEGSPTDRGNLTRGSYVWAKAEAEAIALKRGATINTKTLRLGPLVDFGNFTAPGRLGREVARLFFAIGNPSSFLSVCDIATAAAVTRRYVADFQTAPPCLNLLEVPAPTRGDLVNQLRAARPDLRVVWLPFPLVRVLSIVAVMAQKLLRPNRAALDLYAAFKSEHYDLNLAHRVIEEARACDNAQCTVDQ